VICSQEQDSEITISVLVKYVTRLRADQKKYKYIHQRKQKLDTECCIF